MTPAQDFASHDIDSINDPYRRAEAVTPDNDAELDYVTRGIFVGTGGDLAVLFVDAEDPITFLNVPSGTLLPIRVKKVMATNTDAASIVALH